MTVEHLFHSLTFDMEHVVAIGGIGGDDSGSYIVSQIGHAAETAHEDIHVR